MSVQYVATCRLPTPFGEFKLHGFEDPDTGQEHVALVLGSVSHADSVLCRVHSECLTGDCLFSMRCDCGAQLQTAMQRVADEGSGVILYLRQEGRGIGLINKIQCATVVFFLEFLGTHCQQLLGLNDVWVCISVRMLDP